MAILVSPLSMFHAVIARRSPARVVSLLDPESRFPSADGYGEDRHLRVKVHDIEEDEAGLKAPCLDAVSQLIGFVAEWDQAAPILIHCYAGISRSTATAFVTACAHNPNADETEIAWAIRRASPTASPNPRIVAIADGLLDRGGRMIQAAQAIGRGTPGWPDISEAEPFEIPARFAAGAGRA